MKGDDTHKVKRRRDLTPHELDLWLKTTKNVKVYKRFQDRDYQLSEDKEEFKNLILETKSHPRETLPHSPSNVQAAKVKSVLPPLAPIEARVKKKLSKGQIRVDAALDLHGLRQDQAHHILIDFLNQSYFAGYRIILIVTGKGSKTRDSDYDPFRSKGILRYNVPQWLRDPSLRRIVMGFEEAAPAHGGFGALYVRLRRSDRIGNEGVFT
ncbi:MAG: DNA mismatch repair protein MutS [Methylocystaceae bacterium]|nr:DNA mismatch repair protein MutS [Methylocystaceae bacterium]